MSTPFEGEQPAHYAVQIDKDAPTNGQHGGNGVDIRVGSWDAGFCGCFQHCVPNFCMSFCCPCVSLGQISARLGLCSCFMGGMLFFLGIFAGFPFLCGVWYIRSQVRRRFLIPGNCCADCCASCCCTTCTIAQMATHVKSYKPGSCDMDAPDTLPAYSH